MQRRFLHFQLLLGRRDGWREGACPRGTTFVCLVAVLLLTLSMGSLSSAATVTDYVTFTATGFPVGAPTDPVVGSFTITIDPTLSYPDTTAGITLDSLNIALGSALAFNYDASTDKLRVGGIQIGVTGIYTFSDDFLLIINTFPVSPTFGGLSYELLNGDGGGTMTGSVGVHVVPLPPALVLFGSGLLGLVGLRRFRKS